MTPTYNAADHAADIAAALNLRSTAKGWRGTCPVCNDKNPSFSLTVSDDGSRALVYCFAGCEFKDIAAALREAGVPYAANAPAWRGLSEAELSEARTILLLAESDRAAGRELSPDDAQIEAGARAKVIAGEIERLAHMQAVEYDQIREAEAEKLGIRVSTLDERVAATHAAWAGKTEGADTDIFNEPEPWPEPIRGPFALLDGVAQTIRKYIITSQEAADAAALWIAHTHCFRAFTHTPRLNIRAPMRGCGKSAMLDVVGSMVAMPLKADNITVSVVFRLVDMYAPTILADEYDAWLPQNEELRGILNAGHGRGGKTWRVEGDADNRHPVGYRVFAPAALAGIHGLPATLHDRSVVVTLQRARPDEQRTAFDSRHLEDETRHKRMLARWAADNFDAIQNREPQLPRGAVNRLADNWRPLFAIAEVVGGEWPQRAARAFWTLQAEELDMQDLGTLLLEDVRDVFTAAGNPAGMHSSAIIEELTLLDHRPWGDFKHGKPLNERQLAWILKPFKIKPRQLKIRQRNANGYLLADMLPAIKRYVADKPPEEVVEIE
jgi:putative DNA primase/helicase